MAITITTSPDEDVAPAEVRRHEAADHGPDGDGSSGDAADDPVGEGAILALVVGGDERRDGRDHEHGARGPRSRDQPIRRTVRFGLRAVVSEPRP